MTGGKWTAIPNDSFFFGVSQAKKTREKRVVLITRFVWYYVRDKPVINDVKLSHGQVDDFHDGTMNEIVIADEYETFHGAGADRPQRRGWKGHDV